MAHVLNLVVADSTVNCLQAENLFGLVEETACFLSQSYKRMTVWEEHTKSRFKGQEKLYRLKKIGATRWWSKHKALTSIIDYESFSDDFDCANDSWKLVNLFHVLLDISKGNFDCKTKFTARTLINQWTKFEHLFTAFIILDLFIVTSPVSVFLQSKNLDYSKAWKLVENLIKQIQKKRDETHFDKLLQCCKKYTVHIQTKFEDSELEMEVDFPEKRISKKMKMPGEHAQDESRSVTTTQKFKALYFNILDCAMKSIEERFVLNQDLLKDCAILDPKNFAKMLNHPDHEISATSLIAVSNLTNISRSDLINELKQFAAQYDVFKLSLERECPDDLVPDEGGSSDDDVDYKSLCRINPKVKCSQCLSCAFTVLYDLSSQSGLFNNLYSVYKYLMTVPCTQVSCERVFSKLKIVKNKLRKSLGQELLSNFMLMNCERDLFQNINKSKIIDDIACTSDELRKKLMV